MTHPAEARLRRYVEAFGTLDPASILPYYALPCMFVAPFGASAAADPESLLRIATALVEHARQQRYRRSECVGVDTRELASNLAWVGGTFVRFDVDDQPIGRFGFQYLMRHDDSDWRIVVAVAHDAPAPPG